jgi:hypothetical protein
MSSPVGNTVVGVSPANLREIVETLEQGVAAHLPLQGHELPAEDMSDSVPGSIEPPD